MKKLKFKRLGPPCIVPVISQNLIETGQEVEVPEMLASGLWASPGWQLITEPVVVGKKEAK